MIARTCPGPVSNPTKPILKLPRGSCDAHCHIFGPHDVFPFATERTYTPPDVSREDLGKRHDFLGVERAVIVQAACHGADHTALLDALAWGDGRYRGVALVAPDTPAAEIARLHAAGVRGARLHFMPHLGNAPSSDTINAVINLVRPFEWHLALHVAGSGIADYEATVRSMALPVVIDHMARVDLRDGLDSTSVRALLRLLDTGRVWVKLSGGDRIARHPPSLDDAATLARKLAQHAPERVVWGTDFPHPNTNGFVPDDGMLVDLLGLIAPDEQLRQRLLVTNPAEIFDFS